MILITQSIPSIFDERKKKNGSFFVTDKINSCNNYLSRVTSHLTNPPEGSLSVITPGSILSPAISPKIALSFLRQILASN